MNSMTLRCAVLAWLLTLTACGSQLRHPFCQTSLPSFPPEYHGTYEVVIPSRSPEWSGNFALKTFLFRFGSSHVDFSVPLAVMAPIYEIPALGTMCLVDGRLILEQRNNNGTYAISELAKFDQGLVLSNLTFDNATATKAGFKLHYVPKFRSAVQDEVGNTSSINLTESNFVLDNSHHSASQVLAVTNAISVQTVLRRTTDARMFLAKSRIRITTEGFKIR